MTNNEGRRSAAEPAAATIEIGWRGGLLVVLAVTAVAVVLVGGWALRSGGLRPAASRANAWPVPAPEAGALAEMEPDVRGVIAEAQAAVLADRTSLEAWRHLGMVYDAHAIWPLAAEAYQRAADLDPGDARAAYYLAVAMANAGRPADDVIAQYMAASKLAPDHGPLWLQLGETYTTAGRLIEARDAFQQAIKVYPPASAARAHRNLGMTLLALGDPDGAFVELNNVLTIRDDDKVTYATLAQVYNQLAQGEQARAAADRAATLQDTLGYFDQWRLDVLELTMTSRLVEDRIRGKASMGDLDAAIADAKRWEARHPERPSVQRAIGNILREFGRDDLAAPYFERARQLVSEGKTG